MLIKLSTVDGQQTTAHLIELQTLFSLVTCVIAAIHLIKKAYSIRNRLFLVLFFKKALTGFKVKESGLSTVDRRQQIVMESNKLRWTVDCQLLTIPLILKPPSGVFLGAVGKSRATQAGRQVLIVTLAWNVFTCFF